MALLTVSAGSIIVLYAVGLFHSNSLLRVKKGIAMEVSLPSVDPHASRQVDVCYRILDHLLFNAGLLDLTDGIYGGDPTVNYYDAQRAQHDYLLDEVGLTAGSRLLDIGCGNGTLLKRALERGAESAVGITICPQQVRRCQAKGLDVRLINYRDSRNHFDGEFDCVVANGSMEHFVTPQDVADGHMNEIYTDFFRICDHVIDPGSPQRRVATTMIHQSAFSPKVSPHEMMSSVFNQLGSPYKFHAAMLQHACSGWYPEYGTLDSCAEAAGFTKTAEVDGTHDYHLTSEDWFRHVRRSLFRIKTAPKMWTGLLRTFFRHPIRTATVVWCFVIAESWSKQFRGKNPPTTLWRHTWQLN